MISGVTGGQRENLLRDVAAAEQPLAGRHSMIPPEQPLIRQYRAGDRNAVRRLCCQTGFLGEPIDPIFCDRELFADLFTNAYLDYERERALVAEVDGRVVGYLLGSVRANFEWLLLYAGFRTTCKMLFRLAGGRYRHHPRSRRFIRWLLANGFREQPHHPRNSAHLHFNVDKAHRGRGVALGLWNAFEGMLSSLQVAQCYGAFVSHRSRRPEVVYARYGFTVYDRRPTTVFEPEIADGVEVVCARKELIRNGAEPVA
jgi:GNAT superfamily N-acetyltransferase